MQLFFITATAFLTAVYFVYTSQVMKKCPGLGSAVALAASHLLAAAALVPFLGMPSVHAAPVTQDACILLVVAALFLTLSRELYFYAYAHTDVANITIFSTLTPVYTLLAAFLFLHEVPSLMSVLGILLICGSIYGLFLQPAAGTSPGAALIQPFRHIGSSRPILCAFLSTIPTVFAAMAQKKLLESVDPVSLSFYLLLLIGVCTTAVTLALFRPRALWQQVRSLPTGFIVASATLLPLIHVLFCFVMREQHTAVALVLQRTSILYQLVLAYVFLKERSQMGRKMAASVGVIIGFLLIATG